MRIQHPNMKGEGTCNGEFTKKAELNHESLTTRNAGYAIRCKTCGYWLPVGTNRFKPPKRFQ